ncbi:GyrI-like domain-containing protein [Rhizobium sp. 11515TR]|uniref:GyrI-like domain-containing protein n=1 Tax=Rhizobium sp. 11515TR TaxID=2028343 RepID=UPI000BA8C627|nr:GyrI-like domain-containing protein [Rhizobium sp. 11515TR]ASW08516.1 hypothetical protein CKA34_21160 [Rhizobium sp. 11515TR]
MRSSTDDPQAILLTERCESWPLCGTTDAQLDASSISTANEIHWLPGRLEQIELCWPQYAVFTHSGHISDLSKTIYMIWNKTMQGSGLEAAKAPDFELYDHRFDG